MDEAEQAEYEAELENERKVRVTVTLKLERFPRTVDSDEETEDDEVSMIVEDPETKLKDIIVALENKATVGRKLLGAKMMKLRVGVPMRGAVVKLTAKSIQKDKGMASQEIQHLQGFETGAVVFTAAAKGGAGPSTAPEVGKRERREGS